MRSLKERKATLYKILRRSAIPMRNMMRQGSPVDTGRLKGSFQIRKAKRDPGITKLSVYVGGVNGNRVSGGQPVKMVGWRAHWAELGTIRHAGAYFIQPAIKKGIPMSVAIIRAEIDNLLRSL
jgi:HK97 gp10 family phage protein